MKRNWLLAGLVAASLGYVQPSLAQQPTIPIIVKDTTSFYWQIVLAGARKAGKDLGVKVPELGAQSEADINGQISILENAVSGKPAAIVISPTQFAALGKPITEAAKKVKIIGIDSGGRLQGLHVLPDHRQRRRAAAPPPTPWRRRSRRSTARPRATSRSSRPCPASAPSTSARRASRSSSPPSIRASSSRPTRSADGQADHRPQHHDRPDHRRCPTCAASSRRT